MEQGLSEALYHVYRSTIVESADFFKTLLFWHLPSPLLLKCFAKLCLPCLHNTYVLVTRSALFTLSRSTLCVSPGNWSTFSVLVYQWPGSGDHDCQHEIFSDDRINLWQIIWSDQLSELNITNSRSCPCKRIKNSSSHINKPENQKCQKWITEWQSTIW